MKNENTPITLPSQLKLAQFRFVKIKRGEKKPFESHWQKDRNYCWNDTGFEKWLSEGNNYGVLTGVGGLIVIDADTPALAGALKNLPQTFSVKSGGGGLHAYFLCPDPPKKIIFQKGGYHFGELQSTGQQVVGLGSLHESGKRYENFCSAPIAEISLKEIYEKLADFLEIQTKISKEAIAEIEKSDLQVIGKISDLIDISKMKRTSEGWQGANPWHGSETGMNLCINEEKNIFFCFRCNSGGGLLQTVALNEKLIECGKKLRGEKFKEAKKRAKEKYKLEIIEPTKQEEINYEQKSFFENDGKIYEQISDGLVCSFACYDGGSVSYCDKILINENKFIVPINNDAVFTKAVLLPSGAIEFVDVKTLLEEIEAFIHKYVDISPQFEKYCAFYILLSWVYDRLNTICYLRFLGDTGCGKSRAEDVVGNLCYKATKVAGALTAAPIYRIIKMFGGTLIIDEGDQKKSDTTDEITKILNCGFERGKPVMRCNPNDPALIDFFDTYSPKIISSRYPFYDKALEARCLTEKMRETSRKDIPSQLPDEFFEKQMKLRNKLLMFRLKYFKKINPDVIQMIDLGEIEPRLKQANASFAIVFAEVPEALDEFRKFLANYQKEIIEERACTLEGHIVEWLNSEIENEQKGGKKIGEIQITSKNVTEGISASFKELTASKVGKSLKSLGITSKSVCVKGKTKRVLQFDEEQLKKIKQRYIPADMDSKEPEFCFYHKDKTAAGKVPDVLKEGASVPLCEECMKKVVPDE